MDQRLNEIAKVLGRDEILLQLAEECSELSQSWRFCMAQKKR